MGLRFVQRVANAQAAAWESLMEFAAPGPRSRLTAYGECLAVMRCRWRGEPVPRRAFVLAVVHRRREGAAAQAQLTPASADALVLGKAGPLPIQNAVWEAWIDPSNPPARATGELRLAVERRKVETIATAADCRPGGS